MSQLRDQQRTGSVCYVVSAALMADRALYTRLREDALGNLVDSFIVPRKSGRAWTLQKGDLCRVSVVEGPQVGDVNFWNLTNRKEHFYSGKTRQLQAGHLTTYDRLWSCLPYLRPMATIVADSLQYGVDADGASVHDVMGTRCDPYTTRLLTGTEEEVNTCHGNLLQAVQPFGLAEEDIHDVFNIFMCTGWTQNTHQYFVKGSPAQKGNYIEWIADMDLLVALSVCPKGDVSIPVGQLTPDDMCFPLGVKIFRARKTSTEQHASLARAATCHK